MVWNTPLTMSSSLVQASASIPLSCSQHFLSLLPVISAIHLPDSANLVYFSSSLLSELSVSSSRNQASRLAASHLWSSLSITFFLSPFLLSLFAGGVSPPLGTPDGSSFGPAGFPGEVGRPLLLAPGMPSARGGGSPSSASFSLGPSPSRPVRYRTSSSSSSELGSWGPGDHHLSSSHSLESEGMGPPRSPPIRLPARNHPSSCRCW